MTRFFVAPLLAFAGMWAGVAAASDGSEHDLVEKRLRGCLAAGTSSAKAVTLAEAVTSARAFCRPQINDLADIRVREAVQGLEGEAAEDAEARTIRKLNDEIAYAVANFSGLTQ